MKNVDSSREVAKGLKGYLEKAIDTVWSSISDGVGSAAYSSTLKTPYQTRYEIVHGSGNGIANSLGVANSVGRDLRNGLFAGRKKAMEYWGRELEEGRISKAKYDIKVAAKTRNLENRYEEKFARFHNEILPVAFNEFLEGIPEADDKDAIPISYTTGVPSGMASLLLGRAASILAVEPPRTTPPTNKFVEKKVYEVHEPGFVEREFYKITDKIFKYPMKAIAGLTNLMIDHPLIVGAATVTGIGVAADVKFNEGKFTNKVVEYAKNPGKITGVAMGILKTNEPPVAKIKLDNVPEAGNPVKFNASESFDPDGEIVKYKWFFEKFDSAGRRSLSVETTPTPFIEQNLAAGMYNIFLNVEDDKGKIGSAATSVNLVSTVNPPQSSEHEQPFIMYKGKIKIQGSELFQENVVKVLEFLKKFSPPDYQPLMEDVNLIDLNPLTNTLRGGGGGIIVNPDSVLNKQINKSNSHYIKLFAEAFRHEWGHTYVGKVPGLGEQLHKQGEEICGKKIDIRGSDLENCTKKLGKNDFHEWYPGETYADQFRQSALNNLSYVTPEMIEKFNREFSFSEVMEQQ